MEAISGRKMIQEISDVHAIPRSQLSQRKRQLLDGASKLFTRGKKSKEEAQSKELGRAVPADGRSADRDGLTQKSLSGFEAHKLCRLVDQDHPTINVNRQSELLDLPRSTLYCRPTPARKLTLQIMARIDTL